MSRLLLLSFGLVLTALAGFVDALGFIRLGGLYTSLMSGNTTQLGVAIGRTETPAALMPLALLLAFVVGAVVGGATTALTPARWGTAAVLAFETVAVSAAFLVAYRHAPVGNASLLLALAMGAQNAVLAHVQGFRAGTTFVTGALFSFGQKLALALTGRGARFGWAGDGAVWLSLLFGAVAGTVAHLRLDLYALAVPPGIAGLLALVAAGFALRPAPATPRTVSRVA